MQQRTTTSAAPAVAARVLFTMAGLAGMLFFGWLTWLLLPTSPPPSPFRPATAFVIEVDLDWFVVRCDQGIAKLERPTGSFPHIGDPVRVYVGEGRMLLTEPEPHGDPGYGYLMPATFFLASFAICAAGFNGDY